MNFTRNFILIVSAHVVTQVNECIWNIFKLRAIAKTVYVSKDNDLLSKALKDANHRQEINITGEQVT